MSGFVFWVSGLVFGCLDLYLDVWTCICASGLVFWVPTHHPVVYVLAAGAFFFWKMTPLDLLNTYIVKFVDFDQFEVPLVFFFKEWAICPIGYASKTRIDFLF